MSWLPVRSVDVGHKSELAVSLAKLSEKVAVSHVETALFARQSLV